MTKHQTIDRLAEEATLQRLPPDTEAEIRIIVQEELAPVRALLQELVDEKRYREEQARLREAARAEIMKQQAESMRAWRQSEARYQSAYLECTPGSRSRFFGGIGG
jgi:hypothetical protein